MPQNEARQTNLSSSSAPCRFQYHHQCPARSCPSEHTPPPSPRIPDTGRSGTPPPDRPRRLKVFFVASIQLRPISDYDMLTVGRSAGTFFARRSHLSSVEQKKPPDRPRLGMLPGPRSTEPSSSSGRPPSPSPPPPTVYAGFELGPVKGKPSPQVTMRTGKAQPKAPKRMTPPRPKILLFSPLHRKQVRILPPKGPKGGKKGKNKGKDKGGHKGKGKGKGKDHKG